MKSRTLMFVTAMSLFLLAFLLGLVGCGGGDSHPSQTLNSVPVITSISPSATNAAGPGFTLTVNGNGFVGASVVRWNGHDRTTVFVSNTKVTAAIPASDIAAAGTAQVNLFNPPPGGGISNAAPFAINELSVAGVVERSSVATDGLQANNFSIEPMISADGRYVVFESTATNLVSGDTNASRDIFLRDTCLGAPSPCTASTIRVSVSTDGTQGNGDSVAAAVSRDPRFVSFASFATNLVVGDTNGDLDVFVRDTCLGGASDCTPSTTRVSVATDGTQGNQKSIDSAINSDGRFLAFTSDANNLVFNDTNNARDVFVRDTCLGAPPACTPSTVRISVDNNGAEANNFTFSRPSISANGRFVAFASGASNLVPNDTNGADDVFVHDTCTAANGCTPTTSRVSVASDGTQANSGSGENPSISSDGRFVIFDSEASNLVLGDTNGFPDLFVRDTCSGATAACQPNTTRVSLAADGSQANAPSLDRSSISENGRFVAFASLANNLVAGDTNTSGPEEGADIFVRDTCATAPAACNPRTVRVSVTGSGAEANHSSERVSMSTDGRFVAFESDATNLVGDDTNAVRDIFVARTSF